MCCRFRRLRPRIYTCFGGCPRGNTRTAFLTAPRRDVSAFYTCSLFRGEIEIKINGADFKQKTMATVLELILHEKISSENIVNWLKNNPQVYGCPYIVYFDSTE